LTWFRQERTVQGLRVGDALGERFVGGHALIVGVGGNLPNTIDDARGLAAILRDPERCAYPADQVYDPTGPNATRKVVLDELKRLAHATSPGSTVIFFFSGHGYRVKTSAGHTYYLITTGYDVNRLGETAISDADLTEHLRAIPAQKMLVLLDCCHAGGLELAKSSEVELTKAALPPEATQYLAQGSGHAVLASSRADELSYAGKPYSAFTLALIEALAGRGASKPDGYARMADLALYAREMVPQRTKNRQHPTFDFKGADNFAVAYYAGGDAHPKHLPFTGEPEIEAEPGAFRLQALVAAGRDVVVGGDLSGRDRIGDHVGGDKIQVRDVSGTGIAIGRRASAIVGSVPRSANLERVFEPLLRLLHAVPTSEREEALRNALYLREELAKSEGADDMRIAKLLDRVATLVPASGSILDAIFAEPDVARVAGSAARFALDKLAGR
jgi:hypothetical protein